MPHLLLFAPCQKVILDKADNSMSIIGVLHGLTFQPHLDSGEPIPADAVIVMPWGAATIWLRTEDDEEKTFEQKIVFFLPNGTRFETENTTQFSMTHRTHHIANNGQGFPIGVAGEYRVALHLREVGQEEWHLVSEYPIAVTVQAREETPGEQHPKEE